MTTTTRPSTYDHKDDMIAMRREGASLREIGDTYDVSYEMVRLVLGDDDPGKEPGWLSRDERERETRILEIEAWLETHGPVTRDKVLEAWGITESQLRRMISNGLPSHQILLPERSRADDFTMMDIVRAMQRAWAVRQAEFPDALGLSHVTYDRLRGPEDPSGPLIVSRHGWKAACEVAGIPSGQASRPSYTSEWTEDDLLSWVKRYVDECRAEGVRATYVGYDAWQQGFSDAPSGSTVRNRMRQADKPLNKWGEIVAASQAIR